MPPYIGCRFARPTSTGARSKARFACSGGNWSLNGYSARERAVADYRFENWNRLRAPFCPYFLRSCLRGHRGSGSPLLQLAAQLGVELNQSAGDTKTDGTSLAGDCRRHWRARVMSNLSAVSVASSGCRMAARDVSVVKYFVDGRPLMVMPPLPDRKIIRATDLFRAGTEMLNLCCQYCSFLRPTGQEAYALLRPTGREAYATKTHRPGGLCY